MRLWVFKEEENWKETRTAIFSFLSSITWNWKFKTYAHIHIWPFNVYWRNTHRNGKKMPGLIGISEFVDEAIDDYNSPTTSTFVSKMAQCRQTISGLEDVSSSLEFVFILHLIFEIAYSHCNHFFPSLWNFIPIGINWPNTSNNIEKKSGKESVNTIRCGVLIDWYACCCLFTCWHYTHSWATIA